jgi:NAD(P)-dependent dehydrogenase (short-subunit alcohol dehydrogenase family)
MASQAVRTATELHIVTGSSRGLGAGMVRALLAEGHAVLGLARGAQDALHDHARAHGAFFEAWSVDLRAPQPVAERLEAWLAARDPARYPGGVCLINNAALIPEIGPLEALQGDGIATALRVGLEAPLLLASAFLRATADWPVARKLLNISSGLGRRPMAAQAVYCATKAGLDHASRCIALEQQRLAGGARVVSLAPGVIDTDMQVQLRSTEPERFPDLAAFIGMKQQGQLASADEAAARVLRYLRRADFGDKPVGDIRDV